MIQLLPVTDTTCWHDERDRCPPQHGPARAGALGGVTAGDVRRDGGCDARRGGDRTGDATGDVRGVGGSYPYSLISVHALPTVYIRTIYLG